jgi:hypothetical protein
MDAQALIAIDTVATVWGPLATKARASKTAARATTPNSSRANTVVG